MSLANRPLRVAVVSKADATGGGASRVAADIVVGLNGAGHEAVHLVAWSKQGYDGDRRPAYGPTPIRQLTGLAHRAARKIGFGELTPFDAPALMARLVSGRFDVVHFHDTSSAFSPATLSLVSKRFPTAWTFHDCSPFTGGCLYPQMSDCTRYTLEKACGDCPALGEWPIDGRFDFTASAAESRRKLHASGKISAIAPSKWMSDVAFGSGRFVTAPDVIHNSIEHDLFTPSADRAALRRRLGIGEDRRVLITSAGNVMDPRKGVDEVLASVSLMRDTDPLLVMLGSPDPRTADMLKGVETISTGYVTDRSELADWYRIADGFMFCSSADNQPLAILESMACGVPVFGWPTGGASEMFEDGVSGIFVESRDVSALAARVERHLVTGDRKDMAIRARQTVLDRFSMQAFVDGHVAKYRSMLGQDAAK